MTVIFESVIIIFWERRFRVVDINLLRERRGDSNFLKYRWFTPEGSSERYFLRE